MSQCLVHCNPLVRVEPDHSSKQRDPFKWTSWVFILQVNSFTRLKRSQIFHRLQVTYVLQIFFLIWSPNHVKNNPKLVRFLTLAHSSKRIIPSRRQWKARFAWKKRSSINERLGIFFHHWEQLAKNASQWPDINGSCVDLLYQNELRSSVPTSDDMGGQLSGMGVERLGTYHCFLSFFRKDAFLLRGLLYVPKHLDLGSWLVHTAFWLWVTGVVQFIPVAWFRQLE